jgi:hypothetical protein
MPRFRFNWANVDSSLMTQLCAHLRLPGADPASELATAYGARPREDFIEDTWQVLLRAWLPSDLHSLKSIAASLRERNVGNISISDDLQYLGTCRNTIGLRRVVLPEFISIGEIARDAMGSVPVPKEEPLAGFGGKQRLGTGQSTTNEDSVNGRSRIGGDSGDSPTSTSTPIQSGPVNDHEPNSVDHLRIWARDALRSAFDDQSIEPDDEGDLPIPYGSIVAFITFNDEPLRAEIYAILLREIEYSDQLLKTLNVINARLFFEKVVYIPQEKMIVMSMQLNAINISQQSLFTHLGMLAAAADYFDTQLYEQFGGSQIGEDRKQDEQIV